MHSTNHQRNTLGQISHGCVTTTAALRRAIQNNQESLSALADRFHINIKTVAEAVERASKTLSGRACDFARRLETLSGLTAYEYIVKCWQNDKERFKIYPDHHTLGLNIWRTLSAVQLLDELQHSI